MTQHSALDWRAVARARVDTRLGAHIVYEQSTASTNLLARALLRHGAADGTVVLTDDQTHGRGRLGRHWVVPPYSGLTMSICLHLHSDYPLNALAPATALAVGDVVRDIAGARCTLKWPNDVLVDGVKVAGILIELDKLHGCWMAVVGIGLNLNATPALPTATCLAAIAGAPLAREPLLLTLLAALENYVTQEDGAPGTVMQQWRERLATLGQRVRAHGPTGTLDGLAVDIDAEGALLIRLDDGTTQAIRAGDVTLAALAPS